MVIFATLFRDIKFQVEAVEKIFCFWHVRSQKYRHINSWYFTACSSRVEKRKKSIERKKSKIKLRDNHHINTF